MVLASTVEWPTELDLGCAAGHVVEDVCLIPVIIGHLHRLRYGEEELIGADESEVFREGSMVLHGDRRGG